MPKIFTDEEKADIDRRLREEAAYCLTHFGVKGTTVDQLVKRVNIPKGTFYLFYESKELLLFTAMVEIHEQVESELIDKLTNLADKEDIDAITDIILGVYRKTHSLGVLRLVTTGEIELIFRKLPPEIINAHEEDDEHLIKAIYEALGIQKHQNIGGIAAALRSIFIAMIYEGQTDSNDSYEGIRLCIRGLVLQMKE